MSHDDPSYASNGLFTILFPTTIRQENKVSAVTQWTKNAAGEEMKNDANVGTITRVVNRSDEMKEVEVPEYH
ncbi:hypothetical protein TWF788_004530 [Orbilia oligospora]|uniref:Uncharacterized protein n=1 Tax=Orbilia oligospora TaxID=2813651 RepID=A0A7C8P8H3_ORBOL|nr:hypothetical protein TWF788_004530 [Orbilia oligospora]